MTTGFQQQDRQVNFCFPKTAAQAPQVGRKLHEPAQPTVIPRLPEPQTFK